MKIILEIINMETTLNEKANEVRIDIEIESYQNKHNCYFGFLEGFVIGNIIFIL